MSSGSRGRTRQAAAIAAATVCAGKLGYASLKEGFFRQSGEVHRWMYANVKEKWATIIRRLRHHPEDDKFLAMFSGYGCNARLVMEAIARAGMPRWPATTDALPSWTAQDLHAVVAHVVHLRFPIVVALNKCDLPGAAEHVATLRRESRSETREER